MTNSMEPVCRKEGTWRIDKPAADDTIWLTFAGPTPTDEVPRFIDALTELMPESNARIVFDLRALNGYNAESKEPIKAWLLRNKLAIEELTVIVPRAETFLRMVVAAIGMASGVKIRIRDDTEELGSPVGGVNA
jgi:hypothetical protein